MFASTVSRARRTASSSVSSRSTCTCRPPTGAALVMTTVRGSPLACEVLGGLRLAVVARGEDRAGEVAGPPAVDALRLQHVAAELADQCLRGVAPSIRAACGFR